MGIMPGQTYQKGTRTRHILGLEGFYVIYQTGGKRPRTIGEARHIFEKWLKGATRIR